MNGIEKRIKPLVDILNEVEFISTFSSCEGHFDSADIDKQEANIKFDVKKDKENDFEDLAALILSETAPYWVEAKVEMLKRLYVLPDEKELRKNYEIIIRPFEENITPREKRRYTDEAINRVISAVKGYLNVH